MQVISAPLECGCADPRKCLECLLGKPVHRIVQTCGINTRLKHVYELCSMACVENLCKTSEIVFAGKALSRELGPNPCQYCHGPHSTKICQRCKLSRYCSPECQKFDWPDHKKNCACLVDGVLTPLPDGTVPTSPFVSINNARGRDLDTEGYGTIRVKGEELQLVGHHLVGYFGLHPSDLTSVAPHPVQGFKFGTCFASVESMVHAFGGRLVYGWNVLHNRTLIEFESHAIWENGEGERWNVILSPSGQPEALTFLVHEGFEEWRLENDSHPRHTNTRVFWKN